MGEADTRPGVSLDRGESTPDLATDANADTTADAASDGPDGADGPSDAEQESGTDPDVVEETLNVWITAPAGDSPATPETQSIAFEGTVIDTAFPAEQLTYTWRSSIDGALATGSPETGGATGFTTDTLSPGEHTITLEATNPREDTASDTLTVSVCVPAAPETFDTDIEVEGWTVYGDAQWVFDEGTSNGWLEMTGLEQGKRGAIFSSSQALSEGDVHLSFRFYTGPNDFTGADGFAMSIFDVPDEPTLAALLDGVTAGGGLGYGVAPPYGDWEGNAFHIEIDTYYNNPATSGDELHLDPTSNDHIAITLDGNPAEHLLVYDAGNIEDSTWHLVEIDIQGSDISVWLDEVQIIDDVIPGFAFKGGFLGFSGVTGYYFNYHRFDDLTLLDACVTPR